MALQISRKGKLYVVAEGAYNGAGPTFASADAVRHLDVGFAYDAFNRVNSQEKKQSPGQVVRFDRPVSASLERLNALLRPSGTLNTLPEASEIFEAAFGSKRNTTLSTTVASGGAAGGATLASGAGLAVGDAVLVTVSAIKYVVILDSVAGAVVTWSPDLPGVPSNGAAVKACLTYALTTDLALSLALYHILPNFSRLLTGAGIDKFAIKVNANEEGTFSASGPAAKQIATGLPSPPAAFTSVGNNPPSGLTGGLRIGTGTYLHKNFSVDLTNNLKVRNQEANNDGLPTEIYRDGRREVMLSLDAFAETQATIYDLAVAGTPVKVLRQVGRTEGNIWAVYCPAVEWKVPDTTDGDNPADWAFKGHAYESSIDANDELRLVLA